MLKLNKKGDGIPWNALLAIAAILLVVNIISGGTFPGNFLGQTQTATGGAATGNGVSDGTGVTATTSCPGISGVVLTAGPTEEKWATTATTSEWHQLYLDGKSQPLMKDAATKTVAPGTTYDIYYAFNSSTYYAAKASGVAGCYDFRTADNDGNKYQLYRADTAPTISIYNRHNGNLNTPADNGTLDSGDSKTMNMDISITAGKAISPYSKLVVVLQGNSTAYEKLSIGSYDSTPCPNNAAALADFTTSSTWCYEIPYSKFTVGSDGTYSTLTTGLNIKVQSGVNPVATSGSGAYMVNGTIQDEDYYKHTITQVVGYGVQDNTNTEQGFTSIEFGFYPQ